MMPPDRFDALSQLLRHRPDSQAREDAARLITQGNAIKAGRPIPGYAKTGK